MNFFPLSRRIAAVLCSAAAVLPAAASTITVTYQSIIDPSATQTRPYGINNAGTIVGQAWGGSAGQKTFEYSGGNFTLYNPPTSSGTYLGAINNHGELVGTQAVSIGAGVYIDEGFSYVSGAYTSLNVPGSSATLAYGVNDSGAIVGFYQVGGGNPIGFLDSAGTFTTVSDPNTAAGGVQYAFGINNAGTIVGGYQDASGNLNGYVDQNGVFTTLDVPGSTYTEIWGINSSGNMVGITTGAFCQGTNQGFCSFFYSGGAFTQIAFSGATSTYAYGLNDLNQIVGEYNTSSNADYGFLATVTASSTTPEPASFVLLGSALVGLAFLRRRGK